MNKLFLLLIILPLILNSCKQKVELEKYDKNGNLIVYSEEVYAKMWVKNRNLKVTVIDTFCINQKSKALKDIKNGKLIYFGFHPREFEKMTTILSQYGIETKEQSRSCGRLGGFKPNCYEDEMLDEIDRKFGKNFIDSIFKVAQKEFILENPNIEYIEDGIDLRKKILEKKNSH
jgi:hypothetical protein